MAQVKEKDTWTVGRRKTAVARLKLTEGSGKITVNKKDINTYITIGKHKVEEVLYPITLLNLTGKYDLAFNVKGGGANGQVSAMKHALSRALAKVTDQRSALKKEGLLARDSRMVERKKYGKHKARRGTQFSKR
ncbi:MAG: 30S ribosomal protein S9 [Leptospiraceae bacterium]|nr:30S ribosomal protein S9 [Leptospiraceae bacterium]